MSSIDSKEIIKEIIENDGHYPGDAPYDSIWQYDNQFDGISFKLIYGPNADTMLLEFWSSPFCTNHKLLWSRKTGKTVSGEYFVRGLILP